MALSERISLNGADVVVHDETPVVPPAKCPSPWALAIGTSIVGALAVWTLEAMVKSLRGKK